MNTKINSGLALIAIAMVSAGCAGGMSTLANEAVGSTAAALSTSTPTEPSGPILLEYIGHSCTAITAPDGTRIISDPYRSGGGHPDGLADFPEDLTADVVTISHFHPDHANAAAVNGEPKIYYDPGSYQAGMIKITGLAGDHGLVKGKSTGENTVFVFEIGNVKIVHLGAAGVVTQEDILAAMRNADVIILDVMGDEAHPLKEELAQLLELNTRTIIPTHYSFEGHPKYYGSATLEEFLQIVPPALAVVRLGSSIQVTASMPGEVAVLSPLANESL